MTKCISFKSYTFLNCRVSKTLYHISFDLNLACVHTPWQLLLNPSIIEPVSLFVCPLHCMALFSPFKNQAYSSKHAGSDGGANVPGALLGHGLLWNPQASELLCVLSIPGDSEGIPD